MLCCHNPSSPPSPHPQNIWPLSYKPSVEHDKQHNSGLRRLKTYEFLFSVKDQVVIHKIDVCCHSWYRKSYVCSAICLLSIHALEIRAWCDPPAPCALTPQKINGHCCTSLWTMLLNCLEPEFHMNWTWTCSPKGWREVTYWHNVEGIFPSR